MLEGILHKHKTFLTLTYNEENVPEHGSLNRKDFKGFIKNLRYAIRPRKIRYYGVGEYGDKSWRPHYHFVIYGLPGCRAGNTALCIKNNEGGCASCRILSSIWKKGHIFQGNFTQQSAQYVAGYVTKFSGKKKCELLKDREPEFARMSLKPGIGAIALDSIAAAVKYGLEKELLDDNEIPTQVKVQGKSWPLGRYLSQKLREALGRSKETPKEVLENLGWKMRFMLEENIKRKGWPKVGDLSSIVSRINLQQQRSLLKREEIFKSRRLI